MIADDEFIYARIASEFQQQIRQGLLKPGDRLPSIRELSSDRGISMSTAYKTYVELEKRGLVRSRLKSGYYVNFSAARFALPPKTQQPSSPVEAASVTHMMKMVYDDISDQQILHLSISAPATDLIPKARLAKSMMAGIRKHTQGNTHYESQQGYLPLREQIARHAFKWGGSIHPEDVVTTHGCTEALYFCLKAVTRPGDIVAIESPAYFGVFNLMHLLGLKVLEIPTDPENGVDIEHLEAELDRVAVAACLFIPNFNNPTGCCMPDHRKQQLVASLSKRKIPLVENDIYGEVYFGKSRPTTCKSYDTEGWVLLCSSVTKTLSPGYRIGWCIPGRFKQEVMNVKVVQSIMTTQPTQAAIAHFFEAGYYDHHLRWLRKTVHAHYLSYCQAIAEHFPSNTKVSRPQGGYSLWIELDERVNAFQLYQDAMQQNISISPGQIFSTDGRFSNSIRISFGIPFCPKVEKSFRFLGKLIKEQLR